jgi:GDP/UDP-N,N'-diacetylbacillosamine 2-epimerase (hydrolysing)
MPNADTKGNIIREKLNQFIKDTPHAIGVESLGTLGYLSCMKHCSFLLGNSSSGFVEAAFFPKPVINLGHRQDGRIITSNIINSAITKEEILAAINKVSMIGIRQPINIYGDGNAAEKIISIIKQIE